MVGAQKLHITFTSFDEIANHENWSCINEIVSHLASHNYVWEADKLFLAQITTCTLKVVFHAPILMLKIFQEHAKQRIQTLLPHS